MKVTAVFDIGKTNKKFFLFDKNYNKVHEEYIQIKEIKDKDGDTCDDLASIEKWILSTFNSIMLSTEYDIESINFSSFGASFVHLDQEGKVVTPLYNYLKPYPKDTLDNFYASHGSKICLAKETASPPLQMLNSGLQLYYIKHAKPDLYRKIRWSLHLPQYLSFLITGMPLAEYTSIGCHTMLWDYNNNSYHKWVYDEGIDKKLPPLVSSNISIQRNYAGKELNVGVGIHDSSAALIPYIKSATKPFILLSTGTWSIALNPFSKDTLTEKELQEDCLNFLQPSGELVRAARLFLGNEYEIQLENIRTFFEMEEGFQHNIGFDRSIYSIAKKNPQKYFKWESLRPELNDPPQTQLEEFTSIEVAYHQLIFELVELQIQALKLAIGNTTISTIYIDGGFANNELFVQMLSLHYPHIEVKTSNNSTGSALGAALIMSQEERTKYPNLISEKTNS